MNQTRILCTYILIAFSVLIAGKVTYSQSKEDPDYIDYYNAGVKAYGSKDFETFYSNFKSAQEIAPDHLLIRYYYAAGCALTGRKDGAFDNLEVLANFGVDYGMEKFSAFDSIRNENRFTKILEILKNKTKPVHNSLSAFTLDEKEFLPEGIAYDAATESFYISSVFKRKIVKIGKDGTKSDFISEGQYGIGSILAIFVNSEYRILWALSTVFDNAEKYNEDEMGKTGLFKFDLDTGRLIYKHELNTKGENHSLNDMVMNKNGDLFITDALYHAVHKYSTDSNKMEFFLDKNVIPNVQGITLSGDEKYLFIASYREGIYRIDMKSRKITKLKHSRSTTLYGIDGLYFYKNSLLAIHNGMTPHRIVRYFLDDDLGSVTSKEVLEMKHDKFNEPTLGVIVDDEFFYVANSHWGNFPGKGEIKDPDKLTPPCILRIKLIQNR